MRKLFLLTVLWLFALTASADILCSNKAGAITTRAKCAKGETRLSLKNFAPSTPQVAQTGPQGPVGPPGEQGPAGPPGPAGSGSIGAFDITSCRTLYSWNSTENGAASARVTCGPNEFLLNYGNYSNPAWALMNIRRATLEYSGQIPTGVLVMVQTEAQAATTGFAIFTLYVTATCCPR
jgi:hypothetical protein